MRSNKTIPTTTVTNLTQKTIHEADGDWIAKKINKTDNIFYHVELGNIWPRGSHDITGRWAGTIKPKNKKHANKLYNLDFHDIDKDWYLNTFKFEEDIIISKDAIYFQSKVKNGTGEQIKINNIAIDKIKIINKEQLS